uniref:ATP-dependent Clp protease proteolytic subunit n=1 Tax=Spathodea campanulata TaxID=211926 RepID=A0A6M8AS23_SPACM|nr:clp protease proteolytic subunit [Spathodea campanulata]QKD76274.1 clp protease proteolytic subunit [Spathodea campanulata]
MPVGVPKVPFLIPDDEEGSWVDLYNRLYQQRLLFIGQELDLEIGNQIAGLLIYLTIQDRRKEFFLFINSPGGSVIPGIAVFDTMQWISPDVTTVCMGIAVSMASFVLLGGEITKRLAFPHARVMIHQPSSIPYKYKVRIRFSIWDANEIANIRQHIANVYVQRTGQPYSVIMRDLERDTYMSAEESKEFGIIDDVLYPVSDFEINNTDTEDDSDIWYWEDDPYKFRSFREDVEDGEDDPYKFPWPPEFPPRPSPYKFRWPFKFC